VRVGSGSFIYDVADPWVLGIEGPNPEVAAVAVNSKDEVHVLTRSPHPVLVFDQRGRFLRSFGEGIFSTTHGIHIGPDDTIYIVDAGDSTVRRFSPSGELLRTFGAPGQTSETGYRDGDYRTIDRGGPPFNTPTNVAVAPSNEIYITDGYGNARVHRFREDGTLIASFGVPGRGPGEFLTPHGIFVDRQGTVYVADRENNRIQLFSPIGEFRSEWTGIRRPDDVFVTTGGVAYVAEMGLQSGIVPGMDRPTPRTPGSRVTIRNLDGTVLASLGADGRDDQSPCAPGNFFAAHGIWVDARGSIYVGEVTSAVGPKDAPGGIGWAPKTCHALQVFHRT
jgi:DNA-binding beta-propeller fold protein YncE